MFKYDSSCSGTLMSSHSLKEEQRNGLLDILQNCALHNSDCKYLQAFLWVSLISQIFKWLCYGDLATLGRTWIGPVRLGFSPKYTTFFMFKLVGETKLFEALNQLNQLLLKKTRSFTIWRRLLDKTCRLTCKKLSPNLATFI